MDHVKYLGMYIDKYLNWDYHIHDLCKKLGRANGILSKLRYNAPPDICMQVYYSIFNSNLIYGCNLWGLSSEENIKKVQVLQNKCIRIMTFAPFNSHIPNQTFIDMKLLKVCDIIQLDQLKLIYNFQCTTLPDDLMSLFKMSCEIRTRYQFLNSVVNNLLYVPHFNTKKYGRQSLRYKGPKLWNETFKTGNLKVDSNKNVKLSKIKTLQHLKNALKRHYFYKYSLQQ